MLTVSFHAETDYKSIYIIVPFDRLRSSKVRAELREHPKGHN